MDRALKIISGTLLTILALYFISNHVAKLQLKSALDDFSKTNDFQYKSASVNLLLGNAEIDSINFKNKTIAIKSSSISAEGFSYLKYFFSDSISIKHIMFNSPKITLKPKTKKDTAKNSKRKKLKKPISVKRFSISEGQIEGFKTKGLKNLSAQLPHFEMTKILVDSASVNNKFPLMYKAINTNIESVYLYINKYQDFKVKNLDINNNQITANTLSILPKYGRDEFQKVIPYEKDIITLKIPNVDIDNFKIGNHQNKLLFSTTKININQPNSNIYRDKNAPDDTRQKPMYSEMLRNLPFGLQIDSLAINNGQLVYEEKADGADEPGDVIFTNMEADVVNIININRGQKTFPKTKLDISAGFMKDSQLNVEWQFDISDIRDRFNIKGVGYDISANDINQFFIPAVNARAVGNLQKVYFNYSGDQNNAIGDMRINYDKFKVEILRDDGKKKSGFLSGLVNLFLIDNKEENGTVTKENIEATRDKTRSFWNYFWICIKNGAIKSLTSKS